MAFEQRGIDWRLTATDGATPVMRQVETSFERVQKSYQQLVAALGITLSVGYFLSLIKGSIDAADRIHDLTKSTGLLSEELAGLRLLASQSGSDLEGLAKGVNRMSVEMGKEPEKFRALGITAKDTTGALKQFADLFNLLPDIQQRNALAQKVFSKSWAEMAPILSEGGQKIGEVMERGARLSGITKDLTDQADAFKDKWAELTTTGGFFTRMIGPLLPLLNMLADDLLDAQRNALSLDSDGFSPLLETMKPLVILAANVSFVFKAMGLEVNGAMANIKLALSRDINGARSVLGMVAQDIAVLRVELDAFEKRILTIGKFATEPKDNWDLMGKGGNSAAAAAATARTAAFLKENKEIADNDSAYRNLLKTLKEKLLTDREVTELNKLQLALEALSAKQLATITPARKAELEDLARKIDLRKQEAAVTKGLLDYEEWRAALKKENEAAKSAEESAAQQKIKSTSDMILQMEFETSLIGKTNLERETAIFLRQAEIDKIDAATIARGKEAIAASHAAKEAHDTQVDLWRSVESAGHQASLSIFDTSKSVLERIRDMLKTHLIDILYQLTIKKWIINIAASVSGAGVAQSALGATGIAQTAGGMGSLFSGLGSFASGIAGVVKYADWSSVGGVAAGVTGIADSIFQTMGAKLGSQFIADIGNFNWGVPVLSGVIQALSGNVAGGIGSTIGGIAGSYFGPIGTAVGSFLGSWIGGMFGGGGSYAVGTGYRFSGSTSPINNAVSGTAFALAANEGTSYADVMPDSAGYAAAATARLAPIIGQITRLATALNLDAAATLSKSYGASVEVGMGQYASMPEAFAAQIGQQMIADLIPNLADFRKENEAIDATLNRLVEDVKAVNIVFDTLGKTIKPTVTVTEQLVAVFGGLNNLTSQFQAYYDAFYSDAERLALTQRQLHESFALLNIAEPTTRAGFRALVESMDLTTAAGALTFKALMDLAPAFAQVTEAAAATSLNDAREAVWRAYDTEADKLRTLADQMGGFGKSLRDLQASLLIGANSPLSPMQQFAEAQRQFRDTATKARLGDAEALAALANASQAYLTTGRGAYASGDAYTAVFNEVQAALGMAGDTALRAADNATQQISLLQTQVEELVGIRAGVQTLAEAMAAFVGLAGITVPVAPHAAGGLASGWSLLGERGPELVNFSAPGRVYTAGETRSAISGGNAELLAEIKALRAEVTRLSEIVMAGDIANVKATAASGEKSAEAILHVAWRQEIQPTAR